MRHRSFTLLEQITRILVNFRPQYVGRSTRPVGKIRFPVTTHKPEAQRFVRYERISSEPFLEVEFIKAEAARVNGLLERN